MNESHAGDISICRCSGPDGHFIRIQLNDESSHTRVIDIRLTAEAFGNAVTGLGYQLCAFELFGQHVGRVRECREQGIPFEPRGPFKERKQEAAVALKPYEKDGWKGDPEDLLNHHRRNRDGIQRVRFVRYVLPADKAKAAK